jgi:hypothetical protein
MAALAVPSRSKTPITATSAVSLNVAMNVLTREGIVARKACGSTTSSVVGQNVSPRLAAACIVPSGSTAARL